MGQTKDMILRNRMVRFFRKNIGIFNVIQLPTGTIIAIYDKVYRYAHSNTSGMAEESVSLDRFGFQSPLKNGVAVNPENQCIYFGEYGTPSAVKVMRLWDDGKKAEICYTFPQGKIKHIHSITWDQLRKRLWIATGDANSEVGLYYTDDDFKTVSYFNGENQTWRMVSLLPTENALYWGSEAGKSTTANDVNFIFRWDFQKNGLEKLCEIGNPAYYSVFLENGGMLIGATYEPGMKQQTEQAAEIWYSAQGERWEKICSIPYKNLHKSHRTQFATINLPQGVLPENTIIFTPLNTEKWDFDLVTIQI